MERDRFEVDGGRRTNTYDLVVGCEWCWGG
jgi:hypothetical protein